MPKLLLIANILVCCLAIVASTITMQFTDGELNQFSNDHFGTSFKADRLNR